MLQENEFNQKSISVARKNDSFPLKTLQKPKNLTGEKENRYVTN